MYEWQCNYYTQYPDIFGVQQVKNGQRFEKNRKQMVIKKTVLKSTRIYLDF